VKLDRRIGTTNGLDIHRESEITKQSAQFVPRFSSLLSLKAIGSDYLSISKSRRTQMLVSLSGALSDIPNHHCQYGGEEEEEEEGESIRSFCTND